MQRLNRQFVFALALAFFAIIGGVGNAFAVTYPEKPSAQDFYVDKANIIKPESRVEINKIAGDLLKEQQIPLFVVTIDSLSSYEASGLGIDGYADALFNHWGIGTPERNYGILLLVSLGDRKARIALGAGFAQRNNAQSNDIMQSLIIPAFKRGDYSAGIVDGVRGLDALARGLQLPAPTTPVWFWAVLIGGGLLFAAVVFNLFKRGKSGWAWALLAGLGVLLYFLMRARRGSSGGFGGGSSGGGGSTGSW
jgi:uncharacterized protein